MDKFPSMKGRKLLALLMREPLSYRMTRCDGSHRNLESSRGYKAFCFNFHDNANISPSLVRKVLVKDVGLSEEDARKLL